MLIDMTERDANLFRRILDTFHQLPPESLATPRPQPRPSPGTRKNFVEITSTSKTDGRYPGTVYHRYNPVTNTWEAGDACWVVDSLGTSLATGKKYEAWQTSYAGTPERAVYVTDRDSAGITSLAVGTTGSDVNWTSSGGDYTLHVPDASATARGAVTTGNQTWDGTKTFKDAINVEATACVQFNLSGSYLASIGAWSTPAWGLTIAHTDAANSSTLNATMLTRDATGAGGNAIFRFSDSNPGATQPAYAIGNFIGATGTGGGGDTVIGGLVTALGTGTMAIGNPVTSGTTGGVLFTDGSGDLADSVGLSFDDSTDALTVAGGVVSKLTSAPTGIPTNSAAGPFLAS